MSQIETYAAPYRCPGCNTTWLPMPDGPVRPVGEAVVYAQLVNGFYECDCGSEFRAFAFGEDYPKHPRQHPERAI